MKGSGAQLEHKATGISSPPEDIDLVLMPTNIDGLAKWKIQNTRLGFSLFIPSMKSVVPLNHIRTTIATAVNEKA